MMITLMKMVKSLVEEEEAGEEEAGAECRIQIVKDEQCREWLGKIPKTIWKNNLSQQMINSHILKLNS
jgi:hypothetical protein